MKNGKIFVLLTLVGAFALAGMLYFGGERSRVGNESGETLVVYSAAGMKLPVEALAKQYEKEYGVSIQLQYGGSGTLLSNIRVARRGDVYLAADETYIKMARDENLVQEAIPLAQIRPVIVVPKGNPKNITSVSDLLQDGLKVALANPDAASVGRSTRDALQEMGIWEQLEQHVSNNGVFKPTVNDVANDIKLGTVDAGIVWDATARQYEELDYVNDRALDSRSENVTVGLLASTEKPTTALRFMRYLGARDRGATAFEQHGFEPHQGDKWTVEPEVYLMSGSMLRPAIEERIKAFEQREGVRINRVYNGCGILVSQMRAGERPDAYFSCDVSFMRDVKDLFTEPMDVSSNPIMILVRKGNPKGIRSPEDLLQEGLKVGLGHPKKSALGHLTSVLLENRGLYHRLRQTGNIQVESATGDFLVNQMRAGSLDAAMVYASNAAFVLEHLDLVSIDGKDATAVQPYAVAKSSDNRLLMDRFLASVTTSEARKAFEDLGFAWNKKNESN